MLFCRSRSTAFSKPRTNRFIAQFTRCYKDPMSRLKAITVLSIAFVIVVLFDLRPFCSLGHASDLQFISDIPEGPPKIMLPSGTKLPGGIVESEAQASGGTIKGELFVDGTLTVQGPLVVDGQLLVGDKLGSPLGMA